MTLTLYLAPTIQEGAACGAPYMQDPAKCCRIPHSEFRILRGTHDFADIFMLRCPLSEVVVGMKGFPQTPSQRLHHMPYPSEFGCPCQELKNHPTLILTPMGSCRGLPVT